MVYRIPTLNEYKISECTKTIKWKNYVQYRVKNTFILFQTWFLDKDILLVQVGTHYYVYSKIEKQQVGKQTHLKD